MMQKMLGNLFMIGSRIVDKHAPVQRFRAKGRANAWFSPDLAKLLHERNQAWAKTIKTGTEADWLHFRLLRNNSWLICIRRAKSILFVGYN